MQQTEKYKLNLIETSDTFSPSPLNENMEKLEAALGGVRAEASAGEAALDQRIIVLEGHKVVTGIYTGDGASTGQFIDLGFTPRAVFVHRSGHYSAMTAETMVVAGLKIVEGGFTVSNASNSMSLNVNGGSYPFCAIL